VHSEFDRQIRATNDPRVKSEQSYKGGVEVGNGTPGSVRIYNPADNVICDEAMLEKDLRLCLAEIG
jgi:hypothetical protein